MTMDLLKTVETLTERINGGSFNPEPTWPRVNAYVCLKCGHLIFTVDAAHGTTFPTIECVKPGCSGSMGGARYFVTPDDVPLAEVEYEWRMASPALLNIFLTQNAALAMHVLKGGLLLCARKYQGPVVRHDGKIIWPSGEILTDEEMRGHLIAKKRLQLATADAMTRIAVADKADAEKRSSREKARQERRRKQRHQKRSRRR